MSAYNLFKHAHTPEMRKAVSLLAGGAEVAVPLEGLIDFTQERERLSREREKLQKESAKLEAQLANPQFAERAPTEKANETRERLADIAQRARRQGVAHRGRRQRPDHA